VNESIRGIWMAMTCAVVIWFAAAIAMSALGRLDQPGAPPTYFGLFVAVPIAAFAGAYLLSSNVRAALFAIPLWIVAAAHVLRVVGIFFVAGALTGDLPTIFGWSAGLGDILSAIVCVPLALALRSGRGSGRLRNRFIAWNLFGLTDLAVAIALGLLYSVSVFGQFATATSNSRSLTFLPMSLVPTFYVPMLILLHILALRRYRESTAPMLLP
jgi:hypothetical protein